MLLIIRQTSVLLLLLTLLLGGLYPALVTVIAQQVFPYRASGSFITDHAGNKKGSALIGQSFSRPDYFWGRLSATSPVPYNAASSSGSNLSNSHPDLLKTVDARILALEAADPENKNPVPVDLVTASASGLDPHISIAAAHYQASRVAQARQLPIEKVLSLINQCTEARLMGIMGEPVVNVLQLNVALDEHATH